MPVNVHKNSDGSETKISVNGQFNFSIYQEFREAARTGSRRYVIDLKGTDYMDSSALGMLLVLRERNGGDNADIQIINCNSEIRNVFTIANFDRLFSIS